MDKRELASLLYDMVPLSRVIGMSGGCCPACGAAGVTHKRTAPDLPEMWVCRDPECHAAGDVFAALMYRAGTTQTEGGFRAAVMEAAGIAWDHAPQPELSERHRRMYENHPLRRKRNAHSNSDG